MINILRDFIEEYGYVVLVILCIIILGFVIGFGVYFAGPLISCIIGVIGIIAYSIIRIWITPGK